ncbi:MAG: ABC transporter permease subunit [Phycisphaerales bacterium JB037]
MIKRFLRRRGVRKFRRNRLAVFALGIVGVYFLVALVPLLGIITLKDVTQRVLPNTWPGTLWGIEKPDELKVVSELEQRVQEITRSFARAGESEQPLLALGSLDWAERKLADRPFAELQELAATLGERWEVFRTTYSQYQGAADLKQVLLDELKQYADQPARLRATQADLEAVEAELADLRPVFDRELAGVEEIHAELFPMPRGVDGFVYWLRTSLGSDSQGRSIFFKAVYSTKIAFQIGFIVALVSVLFGTLLGAAAAFYGKWVDYAVMWLVSTLSSIPYIVLLAVVVFMFSGSDFDNATKPALALVPVYVAMCSTFWVGTCRVIRGEVMKIKELEYVQAATSIGFGRFYILIKHVIPNTIHLMFINFSLLFIGAIKSEVILSFLGLGVKGQPSWGVMISQGKDDVARFFLWEVLTATVFMFGLVYAFNIVSDALQDAFDPKHV